MTQKFSHDRNPRLKNVDIDEVLDLSIEDSAGILSGITERRDQQFKELKHIVFEIAKRLSPEAQRDLVEKNCWSWSADK